MKNKDHLSLSKTIGNLIFSANNPFQESLHPQRDEIVENLTTRYVENFSYTTGAKCIWDRHKQPMKMNQCFDIA